MEAIDTTNKFLVGATAGSGRIQIMVHRGRRSAPKMRSTSRPGWLRWWILPVAIEFADTEGIERTLFMSPQQALKFAEDLLEIARSRLTPT
jgi:hypothetical protein